MTRIDLATVVEEFEGIEIEETSFGPIVRVPRESYRGLCAVLKEKGCELSCITAVDHVEKLEVVVHLLASPTEQITVKADLSADAPKVDSLCPIWEGAEWQERETYDMYGIEFVNHPDLTRILLVEDFEGFPLRKSFELEEIEW